MLGSVTIFEKDCLIMNCITIANLYYIARRFSLKMFPTASNYTFYRELPNQNDTNYPYRLRLDENLFSELGRYVYGIVQIGNALLITTTTCRNKNIQVCCFLDDYGNITTDSNRTFQSYTIHNLATKCQFWNESTDKWETTGLQTIELADKPALKSLPLF